MEDIGIALRSIGVVRSPRTDVRDDFWGDTVAEVELSADLPPDSLDGIEDFSHAEIIYLFDHVATKRRYQRPPSPEQRGVAEGRHLRPAGQGPPQPPRQHDRSRPRPGRPPAAACWGWTRWTAARCWTSSRSWPNSCRENPCASRNGRGS